MRNEDLHLGQLYNTDDTALFWLSLPKKYSGVKNDDKIPGRKISREIFSALLGANASGTHRLQPVVMGEVAKPRVDKDYMHEFPVVCYNTKNTWFTSTIISGWFFKHFVPEVRHCQENVLCIAPLDVKALLLLDNAPAHPDAEQLICVDGKICTMFLPPETTSIIQPMDLGVIVSFKRFYQQ